MAESLEYGMVGINEGLISTEVTSKSSRMTCLPIIFTFSFANLYLLQRFCDAAHVAEPYIVNLNLRYCR